MYHGAKLLRMSQAIVNQQQMSYYAPPEAAAVRNNEIDYWAR
jgi:hypothetical protein